MISGPISSIVLFDDSIPRSHVESAVHGATGVQVTSMIEGLDDRWETGGGQLPDMLIIGCRDSSPRALPLIQGAAERHPELPIVVLRVESGNSNGFVRHALEAGAEDVVSLADSPERILETLVKAVARKRRQQAPAEAQLAPLVCVIGPKGGVGKTVTTTNLAIALSEQGHRTTLVDLDLAFGDVGLGLRLTPERTIHDLARVGGSLDAEKVEDFLTEHPSGLRALLAPTRPDRGGQINASFLSQLLTILRQTNAFTVVDTPAGFGPEVLATIDNSSDVCMVGMLDAFSLKDTKVGLETLAVLGYDLERVRIVLNRADSEVGLSAEDVVGILGRKPDVLVPSDRQIARSISEGVPVVLAEKRSAAARAFRQLAGLYANEPQGNHDNGKPTNGRRLRLLRRGD
jgi:pilus assembly protein CpaE